MSVRHAPVRGGTGLSRGALRPSKGRRVAASAGVLSVAVAVALGTTAAAGAVTAATVTTSPSTLTYTGTVGTRSASQAMTVTNTGTATRTVSAVAVKGVNGNQFVLTSVPKVPFTLAAHASATVQAAFAPTVVGYQRAEIDVTSDDPSGTVAKSSLHGTSTAGGGTGTSTLTLVNNSPAGLPNNDRFVFDRIGSTLTTPTGYEVHDTDTVGFHNGGTVTVHVTSLAVSGPFQQVSPVALPAAVAPGATLAVPVRFIATSGPASPPASIDSGSLTATTDESGTPTVAATLVGAWSPTTGGSSEPQLIPIVNQLLGWKTAIQYPGQNYDQNGQVAATGQEVLAPFWLRADTTQPVTVTQFASLHGNGIGSLYDYPRSATGSCPNACTELMSNPSSQAQTLFPRQHTGSSTYSVASFTPAGSFGWNIDGYEYSDDTRNSTADDIRHGCTGACGHHVRFWPLVDRTGTTVTNTYIMTVDLLGQNEDLQDLMFIISNVTPDTAHTASPLTATQQAASQQAASQQAAAAAGRGGGS